MLLERGGTFGLVFGRRATIVIGGGMIFHQLISKLGMTENRMILEKAKVRVSAVFFFEKNTFDFSPQNNQRSIGVFESPQT